MCSFTSSSKKILKAWAIFLLCFLAIFLPYEIAMHKDPGPGSLLVRDPSSKKDGTDFDVTKDNLMIMGSSRAVESVRPKVLAEKFAKIEQGFNLACHSCRLAPRLNVLLEDVQQAKSLPKNKYLLVTIEPLHFSFTPDAGKSPKHQQESGFIDALRQLNQNIQQEIKSAGESSVYSWCVSCHPKNKRLLHVWIRYAGITIKDLVATAFDLDVFSKNYNYYIFNRGMKFYLKTLYYERGFEGMELQVVRQGGVWQDAFQNHKLFYNKILSQFDAGRMNEVAGLLQKLQKKGYQIIFLRLPIYESLYAMEEKYTPDFDKHVQKMADQLNVPYLNMNAPKFDHFTHDHRNFTDSSHLSFAVTEGFNNMLADELRRYWDMD